MKKKLQRTTKGEQMRKILPKLLTSIFVGAIMISTAVDLSVDNKIFAMSGNVNELGIDSTTMYNSDNTSAVLGVDMSNLDQTKYEVKQILGPNNEILDVSKPSVSVDDNAEYTLKVQYVDKTAIAVEEPAVVEEEVTPTSEETPVDEKQLEIKEISLLTPVNGIIKPMSLSQVSDEDASKQNQEPTDLLAGSPRLPHAEWRGKAHEMFPVWWNFASELTEKDPDKTNNTNPSFVDGKFVYYDAQPGGGLPTSKVSEIAGIKYQESFTRISNRMTPSVDTPLKEIARYLGNQTDWEMKMKYKAPTTSATGNARVNYMVIRLCYEKEGGSNSHSIARTNIGIGLIGSISSYPDAPENRATVKIDSNTYAQSQSPYIDLGPKDFFDTERELILKNEYDAISDQFIISLIIPELGKKIEVVNSSTVKWQEGVDRNTIQRVELDYEMGWAKGDVANAGKTYPTGVESYIQFDESNLKYNNFDPKFESIIWKDAKGNVLTPNDTVKVGDKLSITVNMENDIVTDDIIISRLYLNKSSGITTDLSTHGKRYSLKKKNTEPQVINVTVGQGNVGDQLSIGLKSQDTFFLNTIFEDSLGPKIGGDVDYNSMEMKVMELERDEAGNIIKDGSGHNQYVEAANQTILTQDSYVKVGGNFHDKALLDSLNVNLKLDSSEAPGLDFTGIDRLNIVNGTGGVADLTNGTGINLTPNAKDGSFDFIIPVKQTDDGKPFSFADQFMKYDLEISYMNGVTAIKYPLKEKDLVSDTTTRTIKDIDLNLTSLNLTFERGKAFDLLHKTNPLLTFTGANGASADMDAITLVNQGTLADWSKFGLDLVNDSSGIVPISSEDGTEMQSQVVYNQVILLNGKKHYTRTGVGANPAPRTKTGMVTMRVNGGTVLPEAYFEIPKYVMLNDQDGMDDNYAGAKATIGIKDSITSTNLTFDVKGDTGFKINNAKNDFYIVSLFNEDKSEMAKVGNKATVGTFDQNNRKKVVWFNAKNDQKQTDSKYEGTMTFYITSK